MLIIQFYSNKKKKAIKFKSSAVKERRSVLLFIFRFNERANCLLFIPFATRASFFWTKAW